MPRCQFAEWMPISGPSGSFLSGPFKIVHHTTEGLRAEGAFATYRDRRCDPHFTVTGTRVYQHIDTGEAARALRHPAGTPETNRDSAVQIELVGFAGKPKDRTGLRTLARLCRWIEARHGIARRWPMGPPQPPADGGDPGHHRRDPKIWDSESGHFGHCHVPDNIHWDPAYDAAEAAYVLAAEFDADGMLTNPDHPAVHALAARPLALADPPPVVIADHAAFANDDADRR